MQISKRLMSTILMCDAVLVGTAMVPHQAKAAVAVDQVSQESTQSSQTTSKTTLKTSQTSSGTTQVNAEQADTNAEKVGKNQTATSDANITSDKTGAGDDGKAVVDTQADSSETDPAKTETGVTTANESNLVKTTDDQSDQQQTQLNADAQKATKPTLALTAVNSSVQAGADASFTLTVSVPGDVTAAKDQQLVVQLPTNFDLDPDTDLAIGDVTPTQDDTQRTITYDFGNTLPGTSLSKQFSLTTADKPLTNNTELTLGTQLLFDKQIVAEATQSVVVVTKAELKLSNTLLGVVSADADGNPDKTREGGYAIDPDLITGRPGDYAIYQATITAPRIMGQAYLAPGSTIALNVYLPDQMVLANYGTGSELFYLLDENGQIMPNAYQFQFTVPSYADQTTNPDSLVSIGYEYAVRLSPDVESGTQLTIVTQTGAETVDGTMVTSQQIGTQMTVAGKLADEDVPERDGVIHYSQTYAPTTLQITPNGTLQFIARVSAGFAYYYNNSANPAFKGHDDTDASISKFVINYVVDPHLNADILYLSAPVEDHGTGSFTTLQTLPKFDLYVKYRDTEEFEATKLTDYSYGTVDLNQYVDNDRGVEQLKLVFTTIPSGMSYYNGVGFELTPKSGYYGTVTNDLSVEVAGIVYGGFYDILYGKDGATVLPGSYDTSDSDQDVGKDYNEIHLSDSGWTGEELADEVATRKAIMAPRSAEIVKPAESAAIINEDATFAKANNGIVDEGDNQLQISISNDEVATDYLTGVTTAVVLPKGVSYNGDVTGVQVLDSDYQGTGQTLLGITWTDDAITPGRANTVNLPVTVAAVSGLNQLSIGVYSNVDGDTATALKSDQLDATVPVVAGNYDFLDADRLAFGRLITYGSTLTQDATLVRLVTATRSQIAAGQTGTANLQFSDATADALDQLTVTGAVVPETGLTLTGPVTLPTDWQHQATVVYTTDDDPTSTTNWQSAADVADYSQVTGFKVTYQKTGSYLAGGAQTIAVPVAVAGTTKLGQLVGLTYTVTADNLPTVAGIQSVIDVTAPAQTKTSVGPAVSVTADQYYDHTVLTTTTNPQPGDDGNPQPSEPDEPQTEPEKQPTTAPEEVSQPAKAISLKGIPLSVQPLTFPAVTPETSDVQNSTAVPESNHHENNATPSETSNDNETGADNATQASTSNSQASSDSDVTTSAGSHVTGMAANRSQMRTTAAATVVLKGHHTDAKLADGQNIPQNGTSPAKAADKGWLPQTAEKVLLWAALLGVIGIMTAAWRKVRELRKKRN